MDLRANRKNTTVGLLGGQPAVGEHQPTQLVKKQKNPQMNKTDKYTKRYAKLTVLLCLFVSHTQKGAMIKMPCALQGSQSQL